MVFLTDVSGQHIGPMFRGQIGFYLALEDGTETLSRNVGKKYHSTLRKIPKQYKCYLHDSWGLKSRIEDILYMVHGTPR